MVRGYKVIFGKGTPGVLGDAPILGFAGPGEPGVRCRLNRDERANKRARAKQRRKARRRR